jgi:hypothetical protein
VAPPVKLTPRLEHAICDLVREGIPLVDAAHALGLGGRTVYRWVWWGRHPRDSHPAIYARFVDGLQAAAAERREHVRGRIAAAHEDADRDRQLIVAELLDDARQRLNAE